MKLLKWMRGVATVKIRGESPEDCLNLFAEHQLSFWRIQLIGSKEITLQIYNADLETAGRLALSSCCDLTLLQRSGFPQIMRKILHRPVLIMGILLAAILPFLLQNFVWSVDVRGDDPYTNRKILQLLQEQGIGFAANATALDSQQIKLDLLRQLPDLSWMAVNRNGGKLTVFYLINTSKENSENSTAANLIAIRDAVITDFTVLEGMRLFSAGDTVQKGQLLVSGFEDYGLCLRAVRAEGEIYGETWRSATILSPANQHKKSYTGREWTEYICILGRKKINLFGNSGISTLTCDKIIDEHILRLPKLEFPLRIQVVHYREYVLYDDPKSAETVRTELEQYWHNSVLSQMVAGEIIHTEASFLAQGEYYVLRASSLCREMIARTVPMEGIDKGETYE